MNISIEIKPNCLTRKIGGWITARKALNASSTLRQRMYLRYCETRVRFARNSQ